MATGFTTTGSDFDAQFIRREFFQEGQLYGSGLNSYGDLGTNDSTDYSSPVQTIAAGLNWKSITTGQAFAAGIKTDGTLWLWGRNSYGQLGTNDTTHRSSPVQTISAGNNWKQVSAMRYHSCAIKTDGTLWTWGFNQYGQLGDNTGVTKSSPVQTIATDANWKQVAAGYTHSAAIKTDGTLWLWGQNYGYLGDGTGTRKSSPVQTISAGNNWKQVSCGKSTAAIKTDGTLWMWGYNGQGQLGDNTITDRSSPVQTISTGNNWKQVSSGLYHISAIKTDGTLWVWGQNSYGQLGVNDIVNRSSPVQTVAGGTNWKQTASAYRGNIYGIKTDGTLWGWGWNLGGVLRDGTATKKSSPIQMTAGGNDWRQVSGGDVYVFTLNTIT